MSNSTEDATRNPLGVGVVAFQKMALFLQTIYHELTQVRQIYYPMTVFLRLAQQLQYNHVGSFHNHESAI